MNIYIKNINYILTIPPTNKAHDTLHTPHTITENLSAILIYIHPWKWEKTIQKLIVIASIDDLAIYSRRHANLFKRLANLSVEDESFQLNATRRQTQTLKTLDILVHWKKEISVELILPACFLCFPHTHILLVKKVFVTQWHLCIDYRLFILTWVMPSFLERCSWLTEKKLCIPYAWNNGWKIFIILILQRTVMSSINNVELRKFCRLILKKMLLDITFRKKNCYLFRVRKSKKWDRTIQKTF